MIEEFKKGHDKPHQSKTPHQPAWIDVVQTRQEEELVERMRELPTQLEASTPKPTMMARPLLRLLQMPIPTFINELERITTPQKLQSLFKTPRSIPVRRFPINLIQPGGSGPEAKQEPEPSCSNRSSRNGAEGMKLPLELHGWSAP